MEKIIGNIPLMDGLSMDCIGAFEGMSIDIVYIPPNNKKPLVVHYECDEFLYVLDGQLDIHIGDKTVTCQTGDYVSVPRNTYHGSVNNTDKTVRLMAVCSPPYKIEYEHK